MVYHPPGVRFKLGNTSATCIEDGKFYKAWPQKAPADTFMYSSGWRLLLEAKLVPRFFPQLSGPVCIHIFGKIYSYLYVFENVGHVTHVSPNIVLRDYKSAAVWLDRVCGFLRILQQFGFAFHDMAFKDGVWNNALVTSAALTNTIMFVDVDSALPDTTPLSDFINRHKGDRRYHGLFFGVGKRDGNLLKLNVCLAATICILTAMAVATNRISPLSLISVNRKHLSMDGLATGAVRREVSKCGLAVEIANQFERFVEKVVAVCWYPRADAANIWTVCGHGKSMLACLYILRGAQSATPLYIDPDVLH